MRHLRAAAAITLAVSVVAGVTACGGGTSSDGGSNESPKTLTYWASNQGPSIEADKKILTPELKKFEKETGIKVKLEVVPWADLLNRILAATTSGQGPDVLNIGNTWSASLQSTGALLPWDDENFEAIGGRDRFIDSAVASAGKEGEPPAAVPLYSLSYALYYNKKMFADAGITAPPATWDQLVEDGRKLSKDGKWALGAEGSNLSNNIHQTFVLGQQHGADFFDEQGKADFTSDGAVAAVKQYVDFMAKDRIIAPGNAEYAQNQSLTDFAKGRTAMVLWQAAATTFAAQGMKPEDWGVAPVPVPAGAPGAGKQTNSMVAGINMAVFRNTRNIDGAKKFVKFMTSDAEQKILCKTYGSIPPVKAAQSDPAFAAPELKVLRDTLATSAAPLPQVPNESQFETAVGTAVKELFADAAAGSPVTTESVKARLEKAQQTMQS
ncbi:sugar ABC transporter substrate-binding protein [Streptomyces sp. NPDC049952]|uniref:ABC transporter substrate-binding protein n=1 Tax=Streptomyces TaxID=1883 RepID=UPI00116ABA13|nr:MULTISPECIES: sugar ABC transporter substrate-binding protein [unclassified Streptomyces]TPM97561.1 sugar ABC transporter substrate-binding protein [Mesorhizobium sp. B2-3-3]MCY1655086.1 sugar ABC transporter substrate-binding protein [Streptomyces sp. SL203]MCY1677582.1 sugar ABC transporter substrate-binding protein [Streptomyces sp. SL294]MDX2621099.1 sugar ABC transporter substrate-binding protein [Streptomyces sp. WI03-5b]MEE1777575.1 sugar ABC transporter substrate-binding protein [St